MATIHSFAVISHDFDFPGRLIMNDIALNYEEKDIKKAVILSFHKWSINRNMSS